MNKFTINELLYVCQMGRYNHLNLLPFTLCDFEENIDLKLQQKGILDSKNIPTLLGKEMLKMIIEYNNCGTYFTFSNYYVGHNYDNNIIIIDDDNNYSVFYITNHELLNLIYIIIEKMASNQLVTNDTMQEISITLEEFQSFCEKHVDVECLEMKKVSKQTDNINTIFIFIYANSIVVFTLLENKLIYHTQESFFEYLKQFLLN